MSRVPVISATNNDDKQRASALTASATDYVVQDKALQFSARCSIKLYFMAYARGN